jgi:hypothetical protein
MRHSLKYFLTRIVQIKDMRCCRAVHREKSHWLLAICAIHHVTFANYSEIHYARESQSINQPKKSKLVIRVNNHFLESAKHTYFQGRVLSSRVQQQILFCARCSSIKFQYIRDTTSKWHIIILKKYSRRPRRDCD